MVKYKMKLYCDNKPVFKVKVERLEELDNEFKIMKRKFGMGNGKNKSRSK